MKNNHLGEVGYFLAGTVLGGAVAMLVTPFSGRRARRALKHKIEDGSDHIIEATEKLKDQCSELIEDGGKIVRKVSKIA